MDDILLLELDTPLEDESLLLELVGGLVNDDLTDDERMVAVDTNELPQETCDMREVLASNAVELFLDID